jgi:regulator of protease activity HflC (stomatin/prohibitin superfamily)
MNTLQLSPVSAQTPPVPTGGSSSVGEASPPPKTQSSNPAAGIAAQQQKAAAVRAQAAQAAAEREAKAAAAAAAAAQEAAASADTLDRKVGRVDGSFEVFIDLVTPPSNEAVFRVFGPRESAPPPQSQPGTSAAAAYARGPAVPLKDLGVA